MNDQGKSIYYADIVDYQEEILAVVEGDHPGDILRKINEMLDERVEWADEAYEAVVWHVIWHPSYGHGEKLIMVERLG